MRVAIAADKGGFALKEKMAEHLKAQGHTVLDVGMKEADVPVWWHEGCRKAVKLIQSKEAENAVLICGSGAGMALLANKHEGIFAVACESPYTARLAKQFLGANVLTMGGYVVGPGQAEMIMDTFLNTVFAQGESLERVAYLTGQYQDLLRMDRDCFSGEGGRI
ncbi:MAG TPA: RpiB/LacA/LacB family sugar-phosphate isomerase [Candidatus Merdisoma merdipullorum]|nr:RpiB/LacA/LacB family sugar-phosphate isomerase [Candidatus Merdisoma merdipullorum]